MVATLLLSCVVATATPPPKLAAPGLEGLNIEDKELGFYSDHFATQFTFEGMKVTTASQVRAVIGLEREKALLGCTDDGACMTELANALGVDGILTGSIAKIEDAYQLNLKIVSADDASNLATYSSQISGQKNLVNELSRAAKVMAKLMKEKLGKRAEAVAAAAKAEADRLAAGDAAAQKKADEAALAKKQADEAAVAKKAKKPADAPKKLETTPTSKTSSVTLSKKAEGGGPNAMAILGYGAGGLIVLGGLALDLFGLFELAYGYSPATGLLLLGLGTVGVLTGAAIIVATWFVTRDPEPKKEEKVMLVPLVGPGLAGVSLALRF